MQFIRAQRELRQMVKARYDKRQFHEFCADERVEWRFITPSASHQNGCVEALIKSCKSPLKIAIGSQTLTSFEL